MKRNMARDFDNHLCPWLNSFGQVCINTQRVIWTGSIPWLSHTLCSLWTVSWELGHTFQFISDTRSGSLERTCSVQRVHSWGSSSEDQEVPLLEQKCSQLAWVKHQWVFYYTTHRSSPWLVEVYLFPHPYRCYFHFLHGCWTAPLHPSSRWSAYPS